MKYACGMWMCLCAVEPRQTPGLCFYVGIAWKKLRSFCCWCSRCWMLVLLLCLANGKEAYKSILHQTFQLPHRGINSFEWYMAFACAVFIMCELHPTHTHNMFLLTDVFIGIAVNAWWRLRRTRQTEIILEQFCGERGGRRTGAIMLMYFIVMFHARGSSVHNLSFDAQREATSTVRCRLSGGTAVQCVGTKYLYSLRCTKYARSAYYKYLYWLCARQRMGMFSHVRKRCAVLPYVFYMTSERTNGESVANVTGDCEKSERHRWEKSAHEASRIRMRLH